MEDHCRRTHDFCLSPCRSLLLTVATYERMSSAAAGMFLLATTHVSRLGPLLAQACCLELGYWLEKRWRYRANRLLNFGRMTTGVMTARTCDGCVCLFHSQLYERRRDALASRLINDNVGPVFIAQWRKCMTPSTQPTPPVYQQTLGFTLTKDSDRRR